VRGVREEITVNVHCGVHGRVAARLAAIVREYGVEMFLVHDGRRESCDSILGVLSLALTEGTRIRVEIRGDRARQALGRVKEVLGSGRGE